MPIDDRYRGQHHSQERRRGRRGYRENREGFRAGYRRLAQVCSGFQKSSYETTRH